MEKLLRAVEVAEHFGRDEKTIYNWRKGIGVKSALDCIKLGNTVRFTEQQIEDFKLQNK